MPAKDLETIVSLAKRRGFVFPTAEIYGGFANTYDYGPLGVELKRNIREAWWRSMVRERDDVVGLDAALITHPRVWVASGHVATFHDPLADCKKCKMRWRVQQLLRSLGPSFGRRLQLLKRTTFVAAAQATLLALLASTLAACNEPRERIGAELSNQGVITVEYKHCRDSAFVEAVTLKDLADTRTDLSDDRVLWQIHASDGSRLNRFDVGSIPDGFEERVPLSVPLEGLLLNVQVRTSTLPGGESMTFTTSQLRAGELRVGTEYMSVDEFRKRPACD